MLHKLGLTVARKPYLFIAGWFILLVTVASITVGGVLGDTIFDRMKSDAPTVNSSSKTADDIISGGLSDSKNETETVFIIMDGASPYKTNETLVQYLDKVEEELKPYYDTFVSPYGLPKEVFNNEQSLRNLVTENSSAIIINVKGETEEQLAYNVEYVYNYFDTFSEAVETQFAGLDMQYGGKTAVVEQIITQAEHDLAKGEMIALPLTLLVMIFIFGGFLAAGMPIVGALASIVTALGTLYGLSFIMDVDTTVLNVLTVVGLGLSIDYGLLMVSRFRQELRRKTKKNNNATFVHDAVAATVSTAGRTVLFSGLAVAASTATLLIFDPILMKSIGASATSVVLFAVLTALTLLPALFSILGFKLINPSPLQKLPLFGRALKAFGDVAPKKGVFSKITSKVQKKPFIYAISSTLILATLGSSVLFMNVSSNGVDKIGSNTPQGVLFETLDEDFPNLSESDIKIVVNTEDNTVIGTYKGYADFATNDDNVRTETIDTATVISYNVDDAEQSVADLKSFISSNNNQDVVYVTGETARDVDYVQSLSTTAPYVALIIIFITGILLFLMTGSLIIPIKAVFLSILSLGASIGVLVWGFQEGYLSTLLNFPPEAITAIDPLILVITLVFGFGLAMDYEMFLIAAIKEKHAQGKSTKTAVRQGLQSSGRIITSAALMIIIVFSGFAFGDMLMVKMMGVALALAVFIDATIVRMILLPAIMTLFGEKIWWAPQWMKKIHNKYGVEH